MLLLPACYRNIIVKCFNTEIKASHKNCKLMNLLSVFFIFSFCVLFIMKVFTVLIKVYTVFFRENVGGFKKSRLLGDCEKNRLLLSTFITNTKQ